MRALLSAHPFGWAAVFVIAAAISYLLTETVRLVALRRGLLDHPNARSSHTRPTPRGAGVAIVIVTVAGLLLLTASSLATTAFVFSALVIATVSAVDDVRHLAAVIRLSVHLFAAAALLAGAGALQAIDLPSVGSLHLGLLAVPFSMAWVVAVTNGYNFMDGIDGIAGGQALVAGLAWAVLGQKFGIPSLTTIGVLTSAASAGFLILNWSPAKVFMGDVGSAFLGFTFAGLPFLSDDKSARLFIPAALIIWPFLFDTAFTLVARLRRRENIFAAHRSHLYQRLVIAGKSHAEVSLLYIGLDLVGIACAIPVASGVPHSAAITIPAIAATATGLWAFTCRVERLAEFTRS